MFKRECLETQTQIPFELNSQQGEKKKSDKVQHKNAVTNTLAFHINTVHVEFTYNSTS